MNALLEEDKKRPADFWSKPAAAAPPPLDRTTKKTVNESMNSNSLAAAAVRAG